MSEKQSALHSILCEQGLWPCDMVGNLVFNYMHIVIYLYYPVGLYTEFRRPPGTFWASQNLCYKVNKQITIMMQRSNQGAEIFLLWNKIDSLICTQTVISTCLEAAKYVFPLSLEGSTWRKTESTFPELSMP